MSFFKKLFGIKDPRFNHDLTAEDRVAAAEQRSMNRKIKIEEQKLKLAEMRREFALREKEQELEMANIQADLDDMMGGDDQGSMEQMLMQYAMPYVIQSLPKPQNSISNPLKSPGSMDQTAILETQASGDLREISDEQLQQMWDKTPMMAKTYAKTADDDTVILQLKKLLPNCTEDTYIRAFKIVRGLRE